MRDSLDSKTSNFAVTAFNSRLEHSSSSKGSRIILALDLEYRKSGRGLAAEAKSLLEETKDAICAVKINFHLLFPMSLSEFAEVNDFAKSSGLCSIADIKLNDIDNTNRIATEYLWEAGFDAVIVNPFVGLEGALDIVLARAKELERGVIFLGYMSHPGAQEGYGLELKDGGTVSELFLDRAKKWAADAVVVGSTRPDKIKFARASLGQAISIISPGSGVQGGDPGEALRAGADYVIFGRSIISSPDPGAAARLACRTLLPFRAKN